MKNCTYFIVFLLLLSACKTYKNVPYFRDIPDSTQITHTLPLVSFQEARIQPDDILQVSIQTIDPKINDQLATGSGMSYVTQPTSSLSAVTPTGSTGYLVDKDGFIELPLGGRVRVGGLTTEQARDSIRRRAEVYYKAPIINVRFANFQVTILGEVNRPSTYVVPNERIDIIQALGMAGDLTIYGKRENIMIIREENGQKTFARLNLNSSDIFRSPYFQLRQRDIVYVEPSRIKAASTDASQTRIISLISLATTVLVVIISRINFK